MDQETRDAQFAEALKALTIKFHYKNEINVDSYLTTPKTEEEAFSDIQRKYERVQAKLKIPESLRTSDFIEKFFDDLEDLGIYSVLFKLWHTEGTGKEEVKS